VEGSYQYEGVYGVTYEMELHSNSTFTYNWQNGLNKGTTIGTWKKVDAFIILNGGTKPPEQKIMIQESLHPSKDSIYIEVTNFEGDALGMATIMMNEEKELVTDAQGKAVIGLPTIRKIKINYLAFNIPEYQVKNPYANHFVIKAYTELYPSVYFENAKVQIKRNQLIIPGKPLTKEPISLKRLD